MTTAIKTVKVSPSALVIHVQGTGRASKCGATHIAIKLADKVLARARVGGTYTAEAALKEWKRQVNKNFVIVAGMEELHAAALKM